MKNVAVVFETQYGQTAKIAEAIGKDFVDRGVAVRIANISDAAAAKGLDLDRFDAVVIGGPVYVQKFPKKVVSWVREHSAKLASKPTAFFSVSGNAGDKRAEARAADDRLLKAFLGQTGLTPNFVASIAGAIQYTKYGPFKRWIMKKISASAGGSTDTSVDHELTDWAEVHAFAKAIAEGDLQSRFATSVRLRQREPSMPSAVAPTG